ncbi:MAG: NF038104 family lipoprotein [Pseudomonadota bacterium]
MKRNSRALLPLLMAALLTGCLGTVVGTTADVAIEVGKLPFKVAGAAVDVATGDDEDDDKQ